MGGIDKQDFKKNKMSIWVSNIILTVPGVEFPFLDKSLLLSLSVQEQQMSIYRSSIQNRICFLTKQ